VVIGIAERIGRERGLLAKARSFEVAQATDFSVL
jgi:hypothetical protein